MKRTALSIGLLFFTYVLVTAFPEISHGRINSQNCLINTSNTCNVKNSKYLLIFKISGMKSEQDAVVIDKFLSERDFIISSSTDFKTGLCKVETDKVENKAKIIEAICYAGKKNGIMITAELIESPSE